MNRDQPDCLSYLLRLWPERPNDELVWRASLESAMRLQRWGFASLDDLVDFLRQRTGVSSEKGEER